MSQETRQADLWDGTQTRRYEVVDGLDRRDAHAWVLWTLITRPEMQGGQVWRIDNFACENGCHRATNVERELVAAKASNLINGLLWVRDG